MHMVKPKGQILANIIKLHIDMKWLEAVVTLFWTLYMLSFHL